VKDQIKSSQISNQIYLSTAENNTEDKIFNAKYSLHCEGMEGQINPTTYILGPYIIPV